MTAHLYLENAGKCPQITKSWYGYLLICVEVPKHRRDEYGEFEGKRNHRDLVMLLDALDRCNKCHLIVHTDSQYLVGQFARLEQYVESGWKTAKGKDIEYKALWQQVHETVNKKNIQMKMVREKNDHTEWLQTQIKEKRKETVT